MNWDPIQGKWRELKGRFGEKWGKLTDDDLATIGGRRDKLAGCCSRNTRSRRSTSKNKLLAFERYLDQTP